MKAVSSPCPSHETGERSSHHQNPEWNFLACLCCVLYHEVRLFPSCLPKQATLASVLSQQGQAEWHSQRTAQHELPQAGMPASRQRGCTGRAAGTATTVASLPQALEQRDCASQTSFETQLHGKHPRMETCHLGVHRQGGFYSSIRQINGH